MNPELANRLRRFGETVDQAAVAAQAGKAPSQDTAELLVTVDDTDDLPTVVPITAARRVRRLRVITAAAASVLVVAAGALIAVRVTGDSGRGPAASNVTTVERTTTSATTTRGPTTTTAERPSTSVALVPIGPGASSTSSTTSSIPATSATTRPPQCPTYTRYGANYPLRQCNEGPAVRLIQEALGLRVDGLFGPGTRQAVRDFQAANGLEIDGLVGRNTWGAMFPGGGPGGTDADGSGTVDPWEVS